MNKLFVALALALSLSAHARDDESTQPLNRGKPDWPLVNTVAHVFPPFQYKENGAMVGPMLDIMRHVCDESRVRCITHMHAFKDSYKDVLIGDADLIFSFLLADDPERLSLFALSPPIVKTTYSFFVTSTSNWKWTGDPKELDGRTIGVYGPSGTAIVAKEVVAKNPSARLVIEDTNLKVFQQLIVGKYGPKAAIVANTDVGLAFLKSANIYGPKPAGVIEAAVFGFGFSLKSPQIGLAPRMFDAVTELKRRGVIQHILRQAHLEPAE